MLLNMPSVSYLEEYDNAIHQESLVPSTTTVAVDIDLSHFGAHLTTVPLPDIAGIEDDLSLLGGGLGDDMDDIASQTSSLESAGSSEDSEMTRDDGHQWIEEH